MNRNDQIQFYKKQIESARVLKQNARQLEANAARLESEARSNLELLGAKPDCARKGVKKLSDDLKNNLQASLTK